MPRPDSLYRPHELAYRTQYAELKERTLAAGALLPGTPGTLYERAGTGHAYWYRVYYSRPGPQAEDLVCAARDAAALNSMRERIDFAQWVAAQVSDLRKLAFQVADKGVARVLVELHNKSAFEGGLAVVGTLCYMAWLNEFGAKAIALRTQDLDIARRKSLKLAAPLPFLRTVQATQLGFVAIPGLPSQSPSTSVKLPGRDGLRVDVLAPGRVLGTPVHIPELEWYAQAVPHYAYLLEEPSWAAILAGGHCIPVRLPRPERWLWHKLYSSATRKASPEKADKDLLQAVTLAAVMTEHHDETLADSLRDAPPALRAAARKRLPAMRRALVSHPQTLEQFEHCLN
jgi:hypothetical protein